MASQEMHELGDVLTIPNGDIMCKINFFITTDALEHWSKKNLKLSEQPADIALTKFSEQNLKKFQRLLLIVLNKLIQHYKGFPSPIHLTKRVWFCFDELDGNASVEPLDNFKRIFIALNVNYLEIPGFQIVNTIKHELLHVISMLHEGQDNTTELINKWQDKLKNAIDENKKTVDNGINELLAYSGKNLGNVSNNFSKQTENAIKDFYEYSAKKFWNMINDSALCIIAIELDDTEYIKIDIARDERELSYLKNRLNMINKVMAHIIESEPNERKRNFLLATCKLLQFIECFNSMPYEAIAYGILGDDFRPKMKRHFVRNLWKSWHKNRASKNINDFKGIVRKYCEPEVAEGFLRFYDSYLHIIEAQAIHNDPLNPNITQQIHNTECLERGKEAYKTLNREFYKLFLEIKRWE